MTDHRSVAIVCYCPTCDYFVKVAVQADAIGTHGCLTCGRLMEVYVAQGSKEVVQWHP
jgi:transcription elongation factor Elf1